MQHDSSDISQLHSTRPSSRLHGFTEEDKAVSVNVSTYTVIAMRWSGRRKRATFLEPSRPPSSRWEARSGPQVGMARDRSSPETWLCSLTSQ